MWLQWLVPATIVVWSAGWGLKAFDSRANAKKGRSTEVIKQLSIFGNTDESALSVAEKFPHNIEPLIRWIDLASRRGEFEEAVRRAEIVRKKFPRETAGFTIGAAALLRCHKRAEAEDLIAAGMKKFGRIEPLLNSLAHLAYNSADFVVADQRFAELRKLFPESRDGYLWGAEAVIRLGRDQGEAEALIGAAIEGPIQSKSDAALIRYAQYARQRNDWAEAARRWTIQCERAPFKIEGYLGQSEALRQLGQWEKAAHVAESADIMFPGDARVAIEMRRVSERDLSVSDPEPESAARPREPRESGSDSRPETAQNGSMNTATLADSGLQRAMKAASQALTDGDVAEAQRQWAIVRDLPDAPAEAWLLAAANAEPEEGYALLRAAATRFTASGRVHHDLARAAERRADWPTAEQAWRDCSVAEPGRWWTYVGLAGALREQNRIDEADDVLMVGSAALPDEPIFVIERARFAQRQDAWELACVRWDEVCAKWPGRWEGPIGLGRCLLRLGRDDEASEALIRATQRFPDRSDAFHDLARLAERRQDWTGAERWWRGFIAIDPAPWWAHAALAAALQHQTRLAEAETVLTDALAQFPGEPNLLAQHARLAEAGRDWEAAMHRWDAVLERSPTGWAGYRGKAAALAAQGCGAEADALIIEAARRFPHDGNALHDVARLAERRRDWAAAEAHWRSFLANELRMGWAHTGLAHALRQQDRLDEADGVLREAARRLPEDYGIAIDAARLAEARQDPDEAIHRWNKVAQLRRASPEGALGAAAVLRRHGKSDAADEMVRAALARLPDEPALYEALGLNAMAREDWTEALKRFEAGQARFPFNDIFRQRLYEVRLRIADAGIIIAVPPAEASAEADANRALVLQFESLGGGGHGCEFGIFQRHFGAEPLGLLRWADVYQDQLATALETGFAGVGEPEFTNLFVPASSGRPEYWTTDKRYHMAMRTFVHADEVPFDRMTRQVTKRLGYLRRKLIDDLRDGSKIFVYKNMKRNLTEAELDRLHRAVRAYGKNVLLYIRYEDPEHPNQTVHIDRPGLLVGYIDHFSHTPDTDQYIGAANDSLLAICQHACTLRGDAWREAG